jgi:putative phosphoesterase
LGSPDAGSDSEGAVVGIISDTHGMLRREALEALRGSDLILHAGDIGGEAILRALEGVAPVFAVRGNTDGGEVARRLPDTRVVEAGGASFFLLHDLGDLDLRPEAAGFSAVVFGHSHRPEVRRDRGVLFFNPGAAGPRRFDKPVTVGRIVVRHGQLDPRVLELEG